MRHTCVFCFLPGREWLRPEIGSFLHPYRVSTRHPCLLMRQLALHPWASSAGRRGAGPRKPSAARALFPWQGLIDKLIAGAAPALAGCSGFSLEVGATALGQAASGMLRGRALSRGGWVHVKSPGTGKTRGSLFPLGPNLFCLRAFGHEQLFCQVKWGVYRHGKKM